MKNRAELHVHSNMSEDVSTIRTGVFIQEAATRGLHTVAFTDLHSVQAFSDAERAAAHSDVRVVYGSEVRCAVAKGHPFRVTLLVARQEGMVSLYRILSALENDAVTWKTIEANRDGLLVGMCGCHGDVYRAVAQEQPQETIDQLAVKYDYFELFPPQNDREREIACRLVDVGRRCGRPLAAVGNVHYDRPEDARARHVVLTVNEKTADHRSWHLRTMQEMLEVFSFLGEETATEVVVDAPNRLAAQVQEVMPRNNTVELFVLDGVSERVKSMVYFRAREHYGAPLPEAVSRRLEEEWRLIGNDAVATVYFIAYQMTKAATARGYHPFPRGMIGSMLTAFLLGITECDPLEPHYHCPRCHFHREIDTVSSGLDLPDADCPVCGAALRADGHHLPWEIFTDIHGDKSPNIALNVSPTVVEESLMALIETVGKENVVWAGMLTTIHDRSANMYMDRYESVTGEHLGEEEREQIRALLHGMKHGDEVFPSVMVKSPSVSFEEITPLRALTDNDPVNVATHMPFRAVSDRLLTWGLHEHFLPDMVRQLEERGACPDRPMRWNDPAVYALFRKGQTVGVPVFHSPFMRNMLTTCRPRCFGELVSVFCLAHGTGTWLENGEVLLKNGHALSELPACREDVFDRMRVYGFERQEAFRISEWVRKGFLRRDSRTSRDMKEQLREHGVPAWYIDALSRIRYLFPRSHATGIVMQAVRCAWYKRYCPSVFYEAALAAADEDVYESIREEYEAYATKKLRGHGAVS